MKLFDNVPQIEDERVLLRKIEVSDAAAISALWEGENAAKYFPTVLLENQFVDKAAAIREMYEGAFSRKESLFLGICLKSKPEALLGIAEIYNYEPDWNKASIGARINEKFWSQDLENRTFQLLKDYLFENTDVKRITAHVMVDDISTQKAIQRLGFRLRRSKAKEDWGFEKPALVNKFVLEKLGNIKYVKIGNGQKTMVILPGLAFKSTLGSADLVASAYGELFKDYTIYLFDDRSNIGENYSIKERAGDIAAEMKTLHLRDAYVYGVSMGGMVGQCLAIYHPELVKKLMVTATAPRISEDAKAIITKWQGLVMQGKVQEAIHESVLDIYAPTTVAAFGQVIETAIGYVSESELDWFLKLIRAILDFDCLDELPKIKCPVLVAGSEGDKVLFPQSSRDIAEKIGCELYMYGPEYGHAVYDEAPEHKQRILDFFER